MTYKYTKEQIQEAINNTSENSAVSMRAAAIYLNIKYDTFRKYAQLYQLWTPNSSGKGRTKHVPDTKRIPLEDILAGNQSQYGTFKLKNRLFSELGWQKICSCCNLQTWLNKPIPLELDHIDGDRYNHKLENLRLLCANCHAQTDTYCAKNKGNYSTKN